MAQNCLWAMFIKENHIPNFTVRLADRTVAISTIHPYTQTLCRNYLTDEPPAYIIRTTQEDIAAERGKSAREDELEERVPRFFPDGYLESLAVYRKIAQILLDDGVLLFHGSAMLMQQSYRPGDSAGMLKVMELADKLGSTVSLYRLWCNMEREAAEIAYKAMS